MKTLLHLFVGSFALLQLGMTGITQDYSENHANGQVIYEKNCLRCHGSNGDGNGPDASTLTVPPANFHSPESRRKSEFQLRSAVIWGIAFSPMHGWFNILDGQEIRDVVQYIRHLAPYQTKAY